MTAGASTPLPVDPAIRDLGTEGHYEREDLQHAMRVLPELLGRPVRGWYVRSFPSERTRRLVAAHPDLTYDSDSVNDELPWWADVDGARWLVVPSLNPARRRP